MRELREALVSLVMYRACPDCPTGKHGLVGGGCARCGTTGRVRRFGRGR